MNKLAQEIHTLAQRVAGIKTAEKWVRFRDGDDHVFFIPFDLTDKARKMYSPYTRILSPRDGIYQLNAPPKLDEAFGVTSAMKYAENFVIFKTEAGQTFALPEDEVGTTRWAWSPWDRSRAQRDKKINVPLSGKLEDAFEITSARIPDGWNKHGRDTYVKKVSHGEYNLGFIDNKRATLTYIKKGSNRTETVGDNLDWTQAIRKQTQHNSMRSR